MQYGKFCLIPALLASSAMAGTPDTHCAPGETVYFSCALADSDKTVSLCGGIDEFQAPLWLQYRFGVIGRAELVFPANKTDSLQKFGGVLQTAKAIGLTVMEVWFEVGAYDYLVEHQSGGDCDGKCEYISNLLVFKRGNMVARLGCEAPVINSLSLLYGHISDDQSGRP